MADKGGERLILTQDEPSDRQLKTRKSWTLPASVVLGGIILGLFLFSGVQSVEGEPIMGGPVSSGSDQGFIVASDAPGDLTLAEDPESSLGFVILEADAALAADSPFAGGGALPNRDEIIVYKIEEGDTLSVIAEKFGISLSTILWANSGVSANKVRPGQEITILPVSGVRHVVLKGDTLVGVARQYQVSTASVRESNEIGADNILVIGQELIIPGGKPRVSPRSISSGSSSLPNYSDYYILPARGYNWGVLHGRNGVDIANACGTTGIYASAAGTVRTAGYGWNGGYRNMVKISHSNSTQTLYAHMSSIAVNVGEYVEQGELIGYVGNTGKVVGATGCHLHFEVSGARNPFAH